MSVYKANAKTKATSAIKQIFDDEELTNDEYFQRLRERSLSHAVASSLKNNKITLKQCKALWAADQSIASWVPPSLSADLLSHPEELFDSPLFHNILDTIRRIYTYPSLYTDHHYNNYKDPHGIIRNFYILFHREALQFIYNCILYPLTQ